MRIVVAGTPDVALPTLDALAASEHEVVLALTRPDAPVGRRRVLEPSPVARRATELGIPVLRSSRPGEAEATAIEEAGAELGVIVAYGALLRRRMLDAPARGWINLHFSMLPRLRGAAPLQRAVMAGEAATGISIFQLEEGLDTGPVFARRAVPIPPDATSGELLAALAASSAADIVAVVDAIAAGTAVAAPQEGEPTFAPKLTAEDGRIDWTLPARLVAARILGATPEPGAVTQLDGQRIKVLAIGRVEGAGDATPGTAPALAPGEARLIGRRVLVGTADAPIVLERVQAAGRQAMDAAAWWRGIGRDRAVLA